MMADAVKAVELLREGKVVAVPTETVYGLAADALNPQAIARVFEIKNRPADNPLICHFNQIGQISSYVKNIPDSTLKLMQHLTPGPVSFMLDLSEDSPLQFATCGSAQVIVRIPDHPLLLEIIERLDHPVAAPSANTSGKVSPTSAQMVAEDLGAKVDAIVDGGECRVGIESTILDARNAHEVIILRHGNIGEKEIRDVLPAAMVRDVKPGERGVTPGSKYRHYAPDTQIFGADSFKAVAHERKIALLLTQESLDAIDVREREKFVNHQNVFVALGSVKDLNDLARKFYSSISGVDRLDVTQAFFLRADLGDSSLAKALQTRLDKIISH